MASVKQNFEILLLKEKLASESWDMLYKSLLSYLGVFGKFEVTFRCTDNVVRFFIACNKDLSSLSNKLDGMLIRPVDTVELALPTVSKKETLFQLVTGGDLLDLREKLSVKKAKDLQYVMFKVRIVNAEKALVSSH